MGVCPYANCKAQGYFRLEEFIAKEWLQILDDIFLHSELATIKYYYRQESVKYIVGKEEMRRQGFKSPNKAEALMIAMFYAHYEEVSQAGFEVTPGEAGRYKNLQQYAITD